MEFCGYTHLCVELLNKGYELAGGRIIVGHDIGHSALAGELCQPLLCVLAIALQCVGQNDGICKAVRRVVFAALLMIDGVNVADI